LKIFKNIFTTPNSTNFFKNLQNLFSENYSLFYLNLGQNNIKSKADCWSSTFKYNYNINSSNLKLPLIDYLTLFKVYTLFLENNADNLIFKKKNLSFFQKLFLKKLNYLNANSVVNSFFNKSGYTAKRSNLFLLMGVRGGVLNKSPQIDPLSSLFSNKYINLKAYFTTYGGLGYPNIFYSK
jgi:hypothetical protein